MRNSSALFTAVCVAGFASLSSPLAAQIPAAGDLDPTGRVLAKVIVSMAQADRFGLPVSRVRINIVADNGERFSIRTDDAGVATAWLFSGSYRFTTPDPVEWQGRTYSWDMTLPIRPGTSALRLSQDNATKVEVAVTAPATPAPAAPGAPPRARPASGPQAAAPAGASQPGRRGVWFNAGVGYGALGCNNCDGFTGGLTGGLSLGFTAGRRVLIGVGTTGWTKSENGTTLTVGTVDARFRFYPSAAGGFFVTGGAGVGSIGADVTGFGSAGETGFGLVGGLGVDFRVANSLSLTPFWNGIAIRTANADASIGQLGLGVTFH
jgi:hypothetical protein